ncbi:SPOR domain-containing protein [Motiliproteus sp.]|uniref:SPOR domain-containing protein n=1 Tax=Motiliproteus sp. TaxID=1898955 RepID=UPI003BABBF5A
MAHDYAKRRQNASKPAARKTSPKPPPKPRRPLWPLLAILLLLGGLGYGLYFLTTIGSDPATSQPPLSQEQVEQPAKPPAKPVVKKPAEPEFEKDEIYKFYELLPKSEVVAPEVEAYKSTPKSAEAYSNYLLQAGSFKSAEDADRLRAKLLLAGLPNVTSSKVVSSNGTVWYRVRTGPFPSRSKLNKAYDKLVRMNLQPLQIKL